MDPDRDERERRRLLNLAAARLSAARTADGFSRSASEGGGAEAAARYQLQGNQEMVAGSSIRADYYAGHRPRHSYNSYADQQGMDRTEQLKKLENTVDQVFPPAPTAGAGWSRRASSEGGDAEAAARYQLQGNQEMAAGSSIRADYYAGHRPRYTDQQGMVRNTVNMGRVEGAETIPPAAVGSREPRPWADQFDYMRSQGWVCLPSDFGGSSVYARPSAAGRTPAQIRADCRLVRGRDYFVGIREVKAHAREKMGWVEGPIRAYNEETGRVEGEGAKSKEASSSEGGDAEAVARYQLQGDQEMAAGSSIRADYAGHRPQHSYNSYADQQGMDRNTVDQARIMHDRMQWLDAYTQVGHAHDPSWNQHYQAQPRSTCSTTGDSAMASSSLSSGSGLTLGLKSLMSDSVSRSPARASTYARADDGDSAPGKDFFSTRGDSSYSSHQSMGSGSSYAEHRALGSTASQQSQLTMTIGEGARDGRALESPKSRPRKRKSNYSPTPESGEPKEVSIGLRRWLSLESAVVENRDQMVVRMTSVAYAIVELMRAARRSSHQSTAEELSSALNADNFTLFIRGDFDCEDDIGEIVGMTCSDPPSTLRMITPTFVPSTVFGSESKLVSEYLEVAVDPAPVTNDTLGDDEEERDLSRKLGSLLLFIYQQLVDTSPDQVSSDASLGSTKSLLDLGYTSSVQLLVTELLEGELYLDEASIDLHAMLLEPSIFLYENAPVLAQPTLSLGKKKLYGREGEQSAITDAFCRVATTGRSEALLIGGFSGE